jgi:hypothetical protein
MSSYSDDRRFLETKQSRRAAVASVLSLYALATIVLYTTSRPTALLEQVALFPGKFYFDAVSVLDEFAAVSAFQPFALNAIYAVLATLLWSAAAFLLDYYGFTNIEGTLLKLLVGLGIVFLAGVLATGVGAQYVALSIIAVVVSFLTIYVP